MQCGYMYGDTVPLAYKFTGKERDAESGLDDFGARYHASALGRFMTPDWDAKPVAVPYAKFGDPQTLNLYSYVENGPVNRADADGHADKENQTTPTTSPCNDGQQGCPGKPVAQNEWSLSWQVSASANFLGQELKGVWDTTGGAVLGLGASLLSGEAEKNIATTAEWAVTSPGKIGEALKEGGHEIAQTAEAALSGNPHAIGQVAGTAVTVATAVRGVQEAEGLQVVRNTVRSGPRAGELQHVGLVNGKGNIIHLGREGGNWHIGLGRGGGGASGAGATVHIPLPSWLGNLLNH
jgi:RHS repeat-associated protein